MKIIFIGDIVGKTARDKVIKVLPDLKTKYEADAIICNAENAAGGYGLTKKIALDLFNNGVDAITLGNHAWDQKEMLSYIEEGFFNLKLEDGRNLVIVQVMLRLFMGLSLDDPFSVIKKFLKSEKLGSTSSAIIIDLHGEATSEKNAFAHYIDGQVTAILGTHTHIPTSDARILTKGTAYQTDVGMSGDYNSVIGMDKENPIHGFVKGYRLEGRFSPAEGRVTVCGSFVESDDNNGLAKKIETFQLI